MVTHPEPVLPTALEVGPMRRRDLRGVVRIENRVHTRPWSLRLYRREIARTDDRCYLVARAGREVVGYGGLLVLVDAGHIATLAVHPDHQRRGVGTVLLLALARAAIGFGVTGLTLEVRESNTAAQALYRGFGFEVAGVRKGYYAEVGEDALVMWVEHVQDAAFAHTLDQIESRLRRA